MLAASLYLPARAQRKQLAVVLIFALLAASVLQLRLYVLERSQEVLRVEDSIRERRELDLHLIARSDAKRLPPRVYGSDFLSESCSFRSETREIDGAPLEIPIKVISPWCEASYGSEFVARGRIIASRDQRFAFTFIAKKIETFEQSRMWSLLSGLRGDFRRLFAPLGESGALVPGMVIGDTSLQESEFAAKMRIAGLTHLTAVSGTNFSIIATLTLAIASRISRKRFLRVALTLLILTFYAFLVRPSPSVLRAAVMALIVLAAQLSGRKRVGIAALGAAVTALLLIDPFLARDLGFTLSVLATAGIIIISPYVIAWLKRYLPLPKVRFVALQQQMDAGSVFKVRG